VIKSESASGPAFVSTGVIDDDRHMLTVGPVGVPGGGQDGGGEASKPAAEAQTLTLTTYSPTLESLRWATP